MRYLTPVLAAAASIILSTAPASADLGDQLHKLLANDGTEGDVFGFRVAISGTTAIVGAPGDDDNGFNSGSAYLFDTISGTQIAKLLPKDGSDSNFFGRSVAINGTIAIIAAPFDDDNGLYSGSAYLFDTTTGQQITKIIPNDGEEGDRFGYCVAISDTTAIVGAWWDDDNGTESGSAYLFDRSTGQQFFKLLPNDGATGDYFGGSVAIGGIPGKEIAIVGAALDSDNGPSSGSVYLFDVSTGLQVAKLLPNDGAAHDLFGNSVAISNNAAIIGAILDDDNGENSGSAYLFDISTGKQIAKLLPDDGEADEHFGYSVAISGSSAVIGARWDDDNGFHSGSVYIFDISDLAKPTQIAKLLPKDGEEEDLFGLSVAICGTTVIAGSLHDNDNGDGAGAAYIFDATNIDLCPWDLDDSGSVNTSDLLALFAQWGTDGTADFDESGAVGTSDLLILFANWGPCE